MRRWLVMFLFLSVPATFFLVANLKGADGGMNSTPLMRTVAPAAAKAGATITVTGEFLDKEHVAEVYLTAGELTLKLNVVSQDGGKLRFVAPKAEPGRLRLMVLTKGTQPVLIEQPVMLEIQ